MSAKIGEKLKITINDGENEIVEYGNIVEKSINAPTSKDTFIKHLGKLGDTIFNAKDIIYISYNFFVNDYIVFRIGQKLNLVWLVV